MKYKGFSRIFMFSATIEIVPFAALHLTNGGILRLCNVHISGRIHRHSRGRPHVRRS